MPKVSLPGDKFNTLAENRRLIFWSIGAVIAALSAYLFLRKKR